MSRTWQAGRYKEALDEGYRKALELEPNNTQYKEALDMAETRLYSASSEAGIFTSYVLV
jgi:cytochrome c-type biogenesis protein CcmH/NrfG